MKLTLHTGMLSKSRGHVLRIATILHMLFSIDSENPLSSEVSEMAVKAAVNFVRMPTNRLCCWQGADWRQGAHIQYRYVALGMSIKTYKIYSVWVIHSLWLVYVPVVSMDSVYPQKQSLFPKMKKKQDFAYLFLEKHSTSLHSWRWKSLERGETKTVLSDHSIV